ncbi:MAG: DUF4330 domain-containing protein [Oscillospiraceae bacterium]|jgi:hypothetical protein|nr:DUF4330 domain-containing protein [Oscillospiraceae bacterium]
METNKKRFKFNFIDIAIVLIVLAAGAFFIIRYAMPGETTGAGAVPYTLTFENFEVANDVFEGKFAEGDRVYDNISGNYLGTITKIEVQNSKTIVPTAEGELNLTSRPMHSWLIVTVAGEGGLSDIGGLRLGGTTYLENRSVEIRINHTYIYLRLFSIDKA